MLDEVFDEYPFHPFQVNLSSQLLAHGGDFSPWETTGDNAFEVGEIGIHVQGCPMIGDTPAYGDANGGDFLVSNPDPCPGRTPCGQDAVCRERLDQRLFEIAEVDVDFPSESGVEVHQGIDHELAGTMIGDVSSPAGRMNGYLPRIQQVFYFAP